MLAYKTADIVAPEPSPSSAFILSEERWLYVDGTIDDELPKSVGSSTLTHGLGGSEKAGLNCGLLQ